MEPTVKLKDIAEQLNISVVTVSNALSGKKGVSEGLRNKIIKKAEELGYNLHKVEKEVSFNKKVGVLVASKYLLGGMSFYWSMYQQVAYTFSKKGYVCIVEIIDESYNDGKKIPKLFCDEEVAGVIVIGEINYNVFELMLKLKLRVTVLDYYNKKFEWDVIMSNNYLGMYQMTKYLLDRGHRGIGFVGNIKGSDNVIDRLYGYKKCLMENDIALNKEWIIQDRNEEVQEFGFELPNHMPSAFVCASDFSASILYRELTKSGYKVPRDISIVGYDNYLYGDSFFEDITTYDVDMKQMAKVSVDTLIKRIKNEAKEYSVKYIDGEVVERNSVRDIKMSF